MKVIFMKKSHDELNEKCASLNKEYTKLDLEIKELLKIKSDLSAEYIKITRKQLTSKYNKLNDLEIKNIESELRNIDLEIEKTDIQIRELDSKRNEIKNMHDETKSLLNRSVVKNSEYTKKVTLDNINDGSKSSDSNNSSDKISSHIVALVAVGIVSIPIFGIHVRIYDGKTPFELVAADGFYGIISIVIVLSFTYIVAYACSRRSTSYSDYDTFTESDNSTNAIRKASKTTYDGYSFYNDGTMTDSDGKTYNSYDGGKTYCSDIDSPSCPSVKIDPINGSVLRKDIGGWYNGCIKVEDD